MKVKGPAILIFLGILISVAVDLYAAELYDIMGKHILTTETDMASNKPRSAVVSIGNYNTLHDNTINLASGLYFIIHDPAGPSAFNSILDEFSYIDVTSQYLPQYEWDGGAVQIGDLDNDGQEDIVFSRYTSTSIGGEDYRLRVWMQNEDNTFTDESLARIPPVSTPCYDFKLFDVDNDGDYDLFTSGYLFSGEYYIPAALFINNGAGYFTDESDTRLPAVDFDDIVYTSDAGDANGDGFLDLIVIILQIPEPPGYDYYFAKLWLNDTQGHFYADSLNRLPANSGYGYFTPFFTDIDNDNNEDLIFANVKYVIIETTAVFSGQNACYRNTGNGFYVDETDSRMPVYDNEDTRDMAFADIDNDGDTDIAEIGFYFGQYNEQNRILINDGAGYFSVSQNAFPAGIEGWFNDTRFGELNDDNSTDIFMTKVLPGESDYDLLFVNDGNGMFVDSTDVLPVILDFSTSAALFDHQEDNDNDIFIVNNGRGVFDTVGQNRLYHNLLLNPAGIDDLSENLADAAYITGMTPNPFNSSTTIGFTLNEPGMVNLSVYNIQGQRVAELFNDIRQAGEHSITWDASDYPSGVYFARLEAGGSSKTAKMVLLK